MFVRSQVLPPATLYIGRVVSAHTDNGEYSFIGDIRRGTETIATNGDVFCPMAFHEGSFVTFRDLNSDPKRDGKFRTESAEEWRGDVPAVLATNCRAMTLFEKAPVHVTSKPIPVADAAKAIENKAFGDFLERLARQQDQGHDLTAVAEAFLRGQFNNVVAQGANVSIVGDVADNEAKTIEEAARDITQMGMSGQAAVLREEYRRFTALRTAFGLVRKAGVLKSDFLRHLRLINPC